MVQSFYTGLTLFSKDKNLELYKANSQAVFGMAVKNFVDIQMLYCNLPIK